MCHCRQSEQIGSYLVLNFSGLRSLYMFNHIKDEWTVNCVLLREAPFEAWTVKRIVSEIEFLCLFGNYRW